VKVVKFSPLSAFTENTNKKKVHKKFASGRKPIETAIAMPKMRT